MLKILSLHGIMSINIIKGGTIMTEEMIITELNGKVTELTEKDLIILLEYRMASEEEKEIIQKLIEEAKKAEQQQRTNPLYKNG